MENKFKIIYCIFIIIYTHENSKADTLRISSDTTIRISNTLDSNLQQIHIYNIDFDSAKINLTDTLNIKAFEGKSKTRDNLTIILPFITLLIGFFLNRGFEYFREKKTIKKEGERWIAELNCLEEPIQNQIKAIEEFLVKHNEDKFEAPELQIYQILDGEIFKSLDKANLLKYLKGKNKKFSDAVLTSNKIHGSVSILNSTFNDLLKKFKEYRNETSKHMERFNGHLNLLMQSVADYTVIVEKKIGKDPINDPVFKQIFELFNKYILPFRHDGNIELFALQENFIIPLIEVLVRNRLDENLKGINIHLSNCDMEIKAIRMEKRYLKENYSTLITFLKNSKQEISELTKTNT